MINKVGFAFAAFLALMCNSFAQGSIQGLADKPLFYEQFLDSAEALAKSLNAEKPEPKGEYEKQAVYEERLANFGKEKRQKLDSMINSKEDLQPEWAGLLRFDANAAEYNARGEKLKGKIAEMGEKISRLNELLAALNFGESSINMLAKKNAMYISRLEKACELMQDYVIQDYARVLTTEKKKAEMVLGSYDPEKEEFQTSLTDTSSKIVPFKYSGVIKITPEQARAIDRKTDDFTASVDYINYPFAAGDAQLYLGAKKANIFYKDKEVLTSGAFAGMPNYEKMDGYSSWAAYADSLISGKLSPKKWDSLYAMQPREIESGIMPQGESKSADSFWAGKGKTIFQIAAFGLSGVCALAGIQQDKDMASRINKANRLYEETKSLESISSFIFEGSKEEIISQNKTEYGKLIKDVKDKEKLRNKFYIGAGVFGFAGAVSFFF